MPIDSSFWPALCIGLTAAGGVFTYLAWRRRGLLPALRLAAWSLLPIAALLTGALGVLWNIGSSIVGFVTGLVLNPMVWAGVILAAVSAVLFVVTGVLRGRKLAKTEGRPKKADKSVKAEQKGTAVAAAPTAPQAVPAAPKAAAPARRKPAGDEDFSDIEDILKKHGIN
ncbi:cellulose synthase [Nonomuraea sp. NPDC050310]|uniref:cellulose synthase n=1 Tax=unclassified Nonomuraea TaxID=2593643 RepID=UPI0033E154B4